MSTNTAKSTGTAKIEAADPQLEMVFELSNRANSQWVKRGTEQSNNPQHLNSPNKLFLPMQSRQWNEMLRRWVPTQYVMGANTIYVDDFPVSESETIKGLRSQGFSPADLREEHIRAKNLGIAFTFGLLFLGTYGNDPMLLEFVKNHEYNEERPSKQVKDPRAFNLFNFKPLKKEEKAASRLDNLEADAEAMSFVSGLRKKLANNTYEYNVPVINAILAILDDGVGLGEGDLNQKLEILVRYAKMDGAKFMKAINDTLDHYKMIIGLGVRFEMLEINAKEAKLVIDNKREVICEFTADNEDDRIRELAISFLATEEGRAHYLELVNSVEISKVREQNRS